MGNIMDTKLTALYESILKGDNEKPLVEEVVGKDIKGELEGADKAQGSQLKKTSGDIPAVKPVEGPSMGKDAQALGKGKPLTGKNKKVKEDVESKPALLTTFDSLYAKTINEDVMDDEAVVPAKEVEGETFNDDVGDFADTEPDTEETDVEEEVDLASELRLLADRLAEIADKLSTDETLEGEVEGDMTDDMAPEGEADLDITEEPIRTSNESKEITEAIKSEPTPKVLKKPQFNPKMSLNPKNKIGKSGAGKAPITKATKDLTGRPTLASKTTLGPKMSQLVKGTGPVVTGKGETFIK